MAAAASFADISAPASHHMLHAGYGHKVLQEWQGAGTITKSSLVFPLFIVDDVRAEERRGGSACSSLPVNSDPAALGRGCSHGQPFTSTLLLLHLQEDAKQAIGSMPGQFRWGVNKLPEALDEPVKDGLAAVLLFGVLDVRVTKGGPVEAISWEAVARGAW